MKIATEPVYVVDFSSNQAYNPAVVVPLSSLMTDIRQTYMKPFQ